MEAFESLVSRLPVCSPDAKLTCAMLLMIGPSCFHSSLFSHKTFYCLSSINTSAAALFWGYEEWEAGRRGGPCCSSLTALIMADFKVSSICAFNHLRWVIGRQQQKTTQHNTQTSITSIYLVKESYLVVEDNSIGLFRRWPWQREAAARWAHLMHYGNNGRRCWKTQTHTCTEVHTAN